MDRPGHPSCFVRRIVTSIIHKPLRRFHETEPFPQVNIDHKRRVSHPSRESSFVWCGLDTADRRDIIAWRQAGAAPARAPLHSRARPSSRTLVPFTLSASSPRNCGGSRSRRTIDNSAPGSSTSAHAPVERTAASGPPSSSVPGNIYPQPDPCEPVWPT